MLEAFPAQPGDLRHMIESPIGTLTLTERAGLLVSLDWGKQGSQATTPLFKRAAEQLRAYFAGTLTAFDLPLDPPGTAFQKRVWARMADIPYGQILTYGGLARAIHSSPRAVGGAC
jgi:methylated-DNA-[protein]-cysteine S-methyltransferase